jgi:hypothetical protein
MKNQKQTMRKLSDSLGNDSRPLIGPPRPLIGPLRAGRASKPTRDWTWSRGASTRVGT